MKFRRRNFENFSSIVNPDIMHLDIRFIIRSSLYSKYKYKSTFHFFIFLSYLIFYKILAFSLFQYLMLQQVFNKENDSIKLKHTIPSIPIYLYSSFNYPRSECQTLIPNSIHTCPCLANLLLSNIPNIREKFTVFHNQYVNFLHLEYFFEKLKLL